MLTRDLVRIIPSDTRERVEAALRRFNQSTRDALRLETRLVLQWRSEGNIEEQNCYCHCEVDSSDIGLPERLEAATIPDEFVLAAKLAVWTPALRRLLSGASDGENMLRELGNDLSPMLDVSSIDTTFHDSREAAEQLLELANVGNFDLVKHVLAIDEDVLGAFFYDPTEGKSWTKSSYRTHAVLYWGVIGLCARVLEVSIEGLTVVVLAHELAHAYTHLGFDRDGFRWSGEGFSKSGPALKEGLAQYYTVRAVQRLRSRFPEAEEAYLALLPKQPPAYKSHESWLNDATPEAVGAALSSVRRNGAVSYDQFSAEVKHISGRLGAPYRV